MHVAAFLGLIDFLETAKDINYKIEEFIDNSLRTPLHWSVYTSDPSICEILIDKFHFDINEKDIFKENALDWAIRLGN